MIDAAVLLILVGVAAIAARRAQVLEATQAPDAGWSVDHAVEVLRAPFEADPRRRRRCERARPSLAALRWCEGTAGPDGYRTLFGGRLFDSYDDHPRIAQQFKDQAGNVLWTSAAGCVQFMAVSPLPAGGATHVDTWDRIAARLRLPDFSPTSQDLAAVALIEEAGALLDVRAGRIEVAARKLRKVWASLPDSNVNQPTRAMSQVLAAYQAAGGTYA